MRSVGDSHDADRCAGDIKTGAPMVVALGAVAVMVIPIAAPGDRVPLPWLGAVLAAATVAAFRSGSAPAIRVVLASRVG